MPYSSKSGQAGALPALAFAAPQWARLLLLVLALLAVALLNGCAGSRGGKIPYDVALAAPDSPATQALEDDYRISPLDTLHISVFQVTDLSGDYDVDLTGNISLPLLGNVKAVGLTTAQLDQRLTEMLGQKYLQHPDVSVGVKASSSRSVTVTGSVKQAGVFPVASRLTLLQVIALAHGADEDANPHRVAVFRTVQGQRMAAAFDLTSISRGEAEDPRIYSGDIVVVDGSKTKQTWKSVLQAIPLLAIFGPI